MCIVIKDFIYIYTHTHRHAHHFKRVVSIQLDNMLIETMSFAQKETK